MKIKNIMFTGFMAAILGATGAHAAISVASQAYVDQEVKDNVTEVSFANDNTTYLTGTTGLKGAAVALDTAVKTTDSYVGKIPETSEATNIVAYIQEKTSGLATDEGFEELTGRVAQNETDIGTLNAGADVENSVLNKITTAIGGLTGEVTGDKGVVKTISQTDGKITATRAEIVNADIAADAKIDQSKIDGLTTDLAAKANADDVYSKTDAEAKFAEKATTLEGYGITDAYTQEQVNTKLEDKQNKLTSANFISGDNATVTIAEDGKITISATDTKYSGTGNVEINADNQISVKTAAVAKDATTLVSGNDVYTYAIPKPSEDCTSETGACVLSSDTDGNLTWVMITEPTGIAK